MFPGAVQVLLRSVFFVVVAWHFLLPDGGASEARQLPDRSDQSSNAKKSD